MLQKFYSPIEVVLNSLQTQKGLELDLMSVFKELFDEIISFGI